MILRGAAAPCTAGQKFFPPRRLCKVTQYTRYTATVHGISCFRLPGTGILRQNHTYFANSDNAIEL